HGGPILLFNRSQIGQIDPLHSFGGILGRTRQLESVNGTQLIQFSKRLDLLSNLFTQTNARIAHGTNEAQQIEFLAFNQTIYTIQSHPAVVTDDATTSIIIRQTR